MIMGAVGAVGVVHSPLMAVDTVEVLGATRSDVRQIVDATGVGPGALLLWVNAGAIEEAVAVDPWVADVRVDRIWPNRVVVEVIEHQAVAWIEGIQGWMLVSRDGTVLERSEVPGSGLLVAEFAFPDRLPGDRPADPAWHEIVQMALVLSDDIGGTLRLEMRGAEMWTSTFGYEVRFGHPIDLADKGRTLRAMLAGEIPEGAIIDVSSPLRPAIVPLESQVAVETSSSEG
jgi:cell division protein FtsQ